MSPIARGRIHSRQLGLQWSSNPTSFPRSLELAACRSPSGGSTGLYLCTLLAARAVTLGHDGSTNTWSPTADRWCVNRSGSAPRVSASATHSQCRSRFISRSTIVSGLLVLGLCSALLPIAAPPSVAQSGWTANLVAAYPASYNHATGGGAFNDGTSNEDIVESLQGGDFACSDIVTYLLRVEAGSGVDQVIEVDMSFSAKTTGQSGGAHGDVTFVGMNRGPVQNGAGAGGKDSGFLDDGGSDVTHYEVALDPLGSTLFAGATELLLTMTIDDLDGGEEVIVRIDTRLSCDPGSSPTGNLQATLDQVDLSKISMVWSSRQKASVQEAPKPSPSKRWAMQAVPASPTST